MKNEFKAERLTRQKSVGVQQEVCTVTWQVYSQPAARTAQQVRSIAGTSGSLVSQPGQLYRNSVQVL